VGDLAGPRPVALADLVHQRRAARVREELAAVADQAPDGHDELHPDAAVRVGRHLLQAALAAGQARLDLADEVGRDVDRDPLVGLLGLAVHVAQDHLGAAGLELEAFAAHLLDQDGQLELAAAADLERVARFRGQDLDRDVAQDLAIEAGLDLAAGHELAFAAGQRRGVDPEGHPQRGRVDVQARQRPGIGRVGQGVADRDLGQAGDRHDVARPCLGDLDPLDAVGGLEAGHRPGQDVVRPGSTEPSVSPRRADHRDALAQRIEPFQIRPTAIRPTYSLADRLVTSSWSGWPGVNVGRRGQLDSSSNSGRRSCPARPGRGWRCPAWRSCRRPGTRSGQRSRRGP
jgi:hypothetical protein